MVLCAFIKHYRMGGFIRALPVRPQTYFVHFTGLRTGTPDQGPRGTNWGSFRKCLRDSLERGPQMNMREENELGLAVHWVQQALISAYEDNCPIRPVKTGKQTLKWASELVSLRRVVRMIFNKC